MTTEGCVIGSNKENLTLCINTSVNYYQKCKNIEQKKRGFSEGLGSFLSSKSNSKHYSSCLIRCSNDTQL